MLETISLLTEFWSLLIPIGIYLFNKRQPAFLLSVAVYIFLVLPLTLFAGLIDVYFADKYVNTRPWLENNNHWYNLHSIIRLICFGIFFNRLAQPFAKGIKRWVLLAALALIAANFFFGFEQFFFSTTISSRLFATEAGVLLFYCLLYFLYRLQDEQAARRGPDFWIVIGLSIYVVFNFPFFLSYAYLSETAQQQWWHLHNVVYLLFCIFIAKAFATSTA